MTSTPAPPTRPTARFPWASRWAYLARAAGIAPDAPVVVALSGGADSVLLLHLVHRAVPAPRVLAVHVAHGLRGEESEEDARFCRALCEELGVDFELRPAPLDPDGPDLERRAREVRYQALADAAREAGIATLVTGHHADDRLETLVLRLLRGSELAGLAGPRGLSRRATGLQVARPLLPLRAAEVRALLRSEGLPWREDSSNRSRRFTRNRVRGELIPHLRRLGGDRGLAHLQRFARAVEQLEDELAARTAHLAWRPPAWATACRSAREAHLGGTLERPALGDLPEALRRRALARLLAEGTGHVPARPLLDRLLEDLREGRTARHTLPGDFRLLLRRDELQLVPPTPAVELTARQAGLPFPGGDALPEIELRLALPGLASLPDGRAIQAEIVSVAGAQAVPRRPDEVELDPGEGAGEVRELTVRWARPGDRFHGLGAPGSRPLARFLADAGIPREERGRIPLVFADGELVWVAGLRPSEGRRVRAGMGRRLRLRLLGAPAELVGPSAAGEPRPPAEGREGMFEDAG